MAGLGGPASLAPSGAPPCSCCRCSFLRAPSRLRVPLVCSCPFFLFFVLCASCVRSSVVSGVACPGPRRFVVAPPPSLFFFCVPLVSVFSLLFFWPWVPSASALCGCPAPPPPLFVPFFVSFCLPAVCWFLLPSSLGLGNVWLPVFFLPRARSLVWCVRCALKLYPPPPRRLLLFFCGVPHLVVSRRRLVRAVLCGLWCFWVFFCAVLCCCAGALLFGVLTWCVVGFVAGHLPLALAAPFLLVSCGALLSRAV